MQTPEFVCEAPRIGLSLDISRMFVPDGFFARMEPHIQSAFDAMERLEAGEKVNEDEGRMVGHYWLRAPELAPSAQVRDEIVAAVAQVEEFAADVHAEKTFTDVLCIGIGGSALGPMFVSDALGGSAMRMHFLDNTDPDGMARVLAGLHDRLDKTLCIVTSKSGGTAETRNGMLVARAAYAGKGLSFERHAVAITKRGSDLSREAELWRAQFPMWDWVGGRTNVLSAVGLLPAALQGIDIDALLQGAADCDAVTRGRDTMRNPAALLALMWHHATGGKGSKDMVVLPYKDSLLLFSRYLQQLVMESLGKETDRQGNRVEQGISVYGNKGSTDQHSYVQQLREGVNNFFLTFIRVLKSEHDELEVEPGITAGDYLHAFLLGTRQALSEKGRASMTITIDRVNAHRVGALIALFERAVGLYASLVNVNAYHQPGVEAGKKAAAGVLTLQKRIAAALGDEPASAAEIAARLEADAETVRLLLEYLAANGRATRSGGRFAD